MRMPGHADTQQLTSCPFKNVLGAGMTWAATLPELQMMSTNAARRCVRCIQSHVKPILECATIIFHARITLPLHGKTVIRAFGLLEAGGMYTIMQQAATSN